MTVVELRNALTFYNDNSLVVIDMEEIGYAHLEMVKEVKDEASGGIYCNLLSDTTKNRKAPFLNIN